MQCPQRHTTPHRPSQLPLRATLPNPPYPLPFLAPSLSARPCLQRREIKHLARCLISPSLLPSFLGCGKVLGVVGLGGWLGDEVSMKEMRLEEVDEGIGDLIGAWDREMGLEIWKVGDWMGWDGIGLDWIMRAHDTTVIRSGRSLRSGAVEKLGSGNDELGLKLRLLSLCVLQL